MNFTQSVRAAEFQRRVRDFISTEIRPRADARARGLHLGERGALLETIELLKSKARDAGLWNLFMPPVDANELVDGGFEFTGERLSNLEYAVCAEEMGRVHWSSEVFNCSAPDTGNMEVLHRYGTRAQKDRWLRPLMEGKIRSAFLMTEPDVASSDARNIRTSIRRDGNGYVINGRKWWASGAGDPRCKFAVVMGKSDPQAEPRRQQTMMLVDLATPGITIERTLSVYGYDHVPHGHAEVLLSDVNVPAENVLLGEGCGFDIAQGRLGPGRIHHCMRTIGAAEEALEAMVRRLLSRTAFGRRIADHSVWEQRVARARVDIEMTRLLCLKAADAMDRRGSKAARREISMIKLQAPTMALRIIDDAIQAHGGAGVSGDFDLAADWASVRTLRIADGPDEVHARVIARGEFGRYGEPGA